MSLSMTQWYQCTLNRIAGDPKLRSAAGTREGRNFVASHVQGITSSKALVGTKPHSSPSPAMARDKAELVWLEYRFTWPCWLENLYHSSEYPHSPNPKIYRALQSWFWKLIWALEIIAWIIWAMNIGPNTLLLHHWICRK